MSNNPEILNLSTYNTNYPTFLLTFPSTVETPLLTTLPFSGKIMNALENTQGDILDLEEAVASIELDRHRYGFLIFTPGLTPSGGTLPFLSLT